MAGGLRIGAGRPPGSKNRVTEKYRKELAVICREHTEEAIDTLVTIMKDVNVNPAARVRAAENILDRGYGKPQQAVHFDPPDTKKMADWSDEELAAFIEDNRLEDEEPDEYDQAFVEDADFEDLD